MAPGVAARALVFFPLSIRSSRASISPLATRRAHKLLSVRMASIQSASPSLTRSITLPGFAPVQIVAGPGLSEPDFSNAIDCYHFKQWLKNLQGEKGLLHSDRMSLKQVHIQGVDMFGRRVGFLKFKADIIDNKTGAKIPGIVFSRGPAVAILILLESGNQTYAVLTEQARVPVGKMILELPAGTVDDDKGDFAGTAVREVEEEIGMKLKLEDVVNLTSFLDPATGQGIFPSPGGCDEDLNFFLYKGKVDEETVKMLQGKETGLRDEGELIKVHVVPYDTLWRATSDAKVLCAIALYEMAKKHGLLS